MESDILIVAAKVGLLTSREAQTMSLRDIALYVSTHRMKPARSSRSTIRRHGNIEHDASLSREDFFFGDQISFNETTFSTLLNSNPGSDVYNTTSAGQVMHARLADSLARNPNVTNTDLQIIVRSAESTLYLSAMGNPITGEAPKK